MICHTRVTAISLVAGRFTPIAQEGNPILGLPLQQLIAQEKAPDPAEPCPPHTYTPKAEDSGVGAQRLHPNGGCWPSMTQQPSGLTALKLQAGQTSYGTSEPVGNLEELLYFVTSGKKRNVRKWGPGAVGLETPASGRCPGFQASCL